MIIHTFRVSLTAKAAKNRKAKEVHNVWVKGIYLIGVPHPIT